MIHAKTIVADGWWSKVGSTNLNFSSLVANWEIDLVAEDPGFAAQMEELFEDDLSNAREVRLEGSGQHRRVRPCVRWTTAIAGCAAGSPAAARGRGPPSPGLAAPSSKERGPASNPRACPRRRNQRCPARSVDDWCPLSTPRHGR